MLQEYNPISFSGSKMEAMMRLLVTTNARLYKTPSGDYWTPLVYGYDFFQRYLKVFEEIKLVAHCENTEDSFVLGMLKVNGPGMSIFEVPFPHGKKQYIKMYNKVQRSVKKCFQDCDAAILRIPDQLAFQIYPYLRKNKIPVGVEVTSDSWDFFAPGSTNGILRPFLRIMWHLQQRYLCSTAIGTAYVTQAALQKRYPPRQALKGNGFTANYTNANIREEYFYKPRIYNYNKENYTLIHVSGNIGGYAKGHKELIEVIGILNQKGYSLKLVLVGAGSLSPDLSELIDKYNLKDRIRYTGLIINPEELRNELISADIFVFPSYREGLPRVVIEAMACGLPCVATDLPGIKELLDNDCLVPVKNSSKLAHRIEEMIKDPSRLTDISKRNFDKAQEYGLNEIEDKRSEYFNNLRSATPIKR
jgi:glycosyltransferase involved in cell wall biosynthesis